MTFRMMGAWFFYLVGDDVTMFDERICRGKLPGGFWLRERLMLKSFRLQNMQPGGPWKYQGSSQDRKPVDPS